MTEKEARERLGALGFDSERRHLRCWLGDSGVEPAEYRKVLAALPKNSASAGEILSLLGEGEKAAAILRNAEGARAKAALGEAELLAGNFKEALQSLDEAVAADPKNPWPYVYRCAARFRSGDLPGARADADELSRRSKNRALAPALRAMLLWQTGDLQAARRELDGELPGWALALRASLRARVDDLPGARQDIDAALAVEELPWARLERALILNRTGDYEGALKDLKKVRDAVPGGVEPHLCEAAINLDQARYAEAVAALSRALELTPQDVVARRKRARVFVVENKLEEAQADLEKACAMAPDDLYLRQELLQLLILRDRARPAEKILDGEKLTAGAADFWRGYLRCRQRRYAEAGRLFASSAAAQSPGDVLFERAEFYGLACRLMEDFPKPPPPRGKELIIVGLGYRHPFQVGAASLRAVHDAQATFSNLSDPRVTDFLGLFPVPSRVIVFRGTEEQAVSAARTTLEGFKKYDRIAMVTRGLPVCYGRLAWHLVEGCRERGIRVRAPASTSIFELLPALVGVRPGDLEGLQVRDSSMLRGIDPELPLILYSPKLVEGEVSTPAPLPPLYPKDHLCHLMPGGGENEYAALPVRFGDLPAALDRANPAAILYIPALRK